MSFDTRPAPPLSAALLRHYAADLVSLQVMPQQMIELGQRLIELVDARPDPIVVVSGFQSRPLWAASERLEAGFGHRAVNLCDPRRAEDEWLLLLAGPGCSLLLVGAYREGGGPIDVRLSFAPALAGAALGMLAQTYADHAGPLLAAQRAAAAGRMDPQLLGQITAAAFRLGAAPPPSPADGDDSAQRWRDNLLSSLVHDMRTPLNAVSSALELLDDDSVAMTSGASRQLIGASLRNIAHLNELIRLMLDTGRLADGQLALSWQALQPHIWLAEALSMLRPLLVEKRLILEIQCHPAVSIIWGDRLLLMRMLQNLIGNAIKFTAAGGRIGVRIGPGAQEGSIELRVDDTGCGIDTSEIPYIFQRYFRGHTQRRGGHGLGLYFCRLVAEAHAGAISAESALGAGTTMVVTLPASPAVGDGRNGDVL